MYRLYDFLPSGNGYKVRLLLTQLQIPFELVELNILEGETRSEEFLAINPNGKIPVLEYYPKKFISESNAILYYLAQDTPYFPKDRVQRAKVMEWLFFEQFSHEPNIATPRYWISVLKQPERYQEAIANKQKLGYKALTVMEQQLSQHDFLVADCYTIADISLYGYTHVAEEGGYDMSSFSAIKAWCDRIESQSNYIAIGDRNFPQ